MSVAAVQVNDTFLLDGAVALNEPGALGACVSGPPPAACVVMGTGVEGADVAKLVAFPITVQV